jgi:branched-chain amino acid aminotransferase
MSSAALPSALVYWDGHMIPWERARLPLHDAGLVWGATITELTRTYGQNLFRWPDHLARFRRSCELAAVPLLHDDAALTHAAAQLVAQNAKLVPPGTELATVMLATPGEIGHYLGEPGGPGERPPRLIMHTFPLAAPRFARLLREGATLVVPSVRHVPAACVPPEIKHRSRLFWWRAEQEARRFEPGAHALLVDLEGRITETASANVFVVHRGKVSVPRPGTVLPGVTAAIVVELLHGLGVEVTCRDLFPADLDTAEEVFLSCTSYGLAPVRRIDRREFSSPGPLVRRLWSAWRDLTGCTMVAAALRQA